MPAGLMAIAAALILCTWIAARLFFWWLDRLVPAEREAAYREAGERFIGSARGSVLVIAAHPDDVEYWLGGTLARLAQGGVAVDVVIATRGEKGGTRPDLAAVRTSEQSRAATILGYRRLIWLDLPDRGVVATADLVARLRALLDEICPGLLFTFDAAKPLPPYLHKDHQAVGRAATAAFGAWARRHPESRLVRFHTRRPNVLVDVQSTLEQKYAAFAAHESQHGEPRPALRVSFVVLGALFPRHTAQRTQPPAVEAFFCLSEPTSTTYR